MSDDADLVKYARSVARGLLGSGYVDSYYDDVANDFVGMAQWWASVQVAEAEARAVRAEQAIQRVEKLVSVVENRMMATAKPAEIRAALTGEDSTDEK